MHFTSILLWGGLACAEYTGLMMIGPDDHEFWVTREDRPKPVCDGNAIGVGIDLSTTYGIVAIKYPNQTVVDVGKIDSYPGSSYTRMIQSFYGYRVPDDFIRPPGSGPFWPEAWFLKNMRRERRKAMGLAATAEVKELSDFIKRLYDLAQASTDQPLPKNVLVTAPHLLNLGPQDLDDALDFIGLTNLHRPFGNPYSPTLGFDKLPNVALSQAAASYAGLGFGLCEHWHDYQMCKEEEANMMRATEWGPAGNQILQLTFTKDEFAINNHWVIDKVESFAEMNYCYSPKPGLGLDAALKNESIWGVIKEKIEMAQWSLNSPYEPGQDIYPDAEMFGPHGIDGIILTGESAQEEPFLRVLKEALGEMSVPDMYDEVVWWEGLNSTMSAARGAAVLAERWVWKACEKDGLAFLDEEATRDAEEEAIRKAQFEGTYPRVPMGQGVPINDEAVEDEDEETLNSAKMELV